MVTFIQSTDTFRPVTATVLQPTSQHLPATTKQSVHCHVLNTESKWQTLITNFQHLSATKKQSFQCHVLNTVSDKHWSLISSTCQQQWNSHSSVMWQTLITDCKHLSTTKKWSFQPCANQYCWIHWQTNTDHQYVLTLVTDMETATPSVCKAVLLNTSTDKHLSPLCTDMETVWVTPAVHKSVLLNSDTDQLGKENHPTESGCIFGRVHAPWII